MKAFTPLIKNSYRRISLPTPVAVRHFAQNKGGPPPKGGNFQQQGKPNQQQQKGQQYQQQPPKQQQQQQAPKQPQQQPKQQPPVQQSKGNAPASAVSTSSSLSPEVAKKELLAVFAQEAEEIKKDDSKTELANQVKQYLDQSGFQIEESPEGSFALKKTDKNYSIQVIFEEAPKEEGYEGEEDFGHEDEMEKDLGEDADEDAANEKDKINVTAQIYILDKVAQLPKGTLVAEGFVGGDGRLYVETVVISDSIQKEEKPSEDLLGINERPPIGPALDFHALPQNTQDKMYDFFDSIGIDDGMAGFIKAYTKEYFPVKNEIEFYEKFRKLLS